MVKGKDKVYPVDGCCPCMTCGGDARRFFYQKERKILDGDDESVYYTVNNRIYLCLKCFEMNKIFNRFPSNIVTKLLKKRED